MPEDFASAGRRNPFICFRDVIILYHEQQRDEKYLPSDMCAKWRFRSDCANAQSDQNLHWAHFGYSRMQSLFMWTTKFWVWLSEGVGWFESSLSVHSRRYVFWPCRCFFYFPAGTQRWNNVDWMLIWRWINFESMLFQRCASWVTTYCYNIYVARFFLGLLLTRSYMDIVNVFYFVVPPPPLPHSGIHQRRSRQI